MAFIREDKLRAALAKLEKFARDPLRKRSLAIKRSYQRRREQLAEEMRLQAQERIEELENLRRQKGRIARLPCSGCGRTAEFDLDSVLYLAKLFGGANPDDFLLCPACRSRKGVKRRIKRKIRKAGGLEVM